MNNWKHIDPDPSWELSVAEQVLVRSPWISGIKFAYRMSQPPHWPGRN
jgi:hypothetical protein